MSTPHLTSSHLFHSLLALALIALGAGGRLLLQDVPNVETIMVVSLLGGALLGGRWGLVVGLGAVAISDAFIGNTDIMLFTWSAWAVIGFASLLLHTAKKTAWSFVPKSLGMGIGAAVFFYLWTNFGVWLIGDLYPATIDGLVQSYVLALPFLRLHMISTLVSVAVGSTAVVLMVRTAPKTVRYLVHSTQRVFEKESV